MGDDDSLRSAAFPRRLLLYLNERFPPVSHFLLILAFYYSCYFVADLLARGVAGSAAETVRVDGGSALGFIAIFLLFFHLRVFDEFKDYHKDRVAHPERVLQRGIITLGELRFLGIAAVAVEIAVNIILGWQVLLVFALVLLWSVLMLYEFFVGEWLRRHLVWYLVTHQIIVPLICIYIYAVLAFRADFGIAWLYGWQVAVCVCACLGFELSRKIRMEEQEMEDTYSKIFGPFRAAALGLAILLLGGASAVLVGRLVGFPVVYYVLLGVATLATIGGFAHFRSSPTQKSAKRLGVVASLYMLLIFSFIAGTLIAQRGVEWTRNL